MTTKAKDLAHGFFSFVCLILLFAGLEFIYPGALSGCSDQDERPVIRGMN